MNKKYLEDSIGEYDSCPSCGFNFLGEDIYQYFLEEYKDPDKALKTAKLYGWSKETPKCFRKNIGIEIRGYYDGVSFYKCPKCEVIWRRFKWVKEELVNEIV